MKKIIIFITACISVLLISLTLNKIGKTIQTNATKDIYGQIIQNNCLLLKENQTPILVLPKSYYVKILDKINDGNLDYYYVEYKSVLGFVSCEYIQLCDTPQKPYQDNYVFNVKSSSYLYSSPSATAETIMELDNSFELEYIGTLVGENLEQYGGNVWYYVKCNKKYGYVYSPHTTGVGNLIDSTEKTSNIVSAYEDIRNMSKSTLVFIIILLFIPMFFVIYLLFAPKIKKYSKDNFF